MRNWQNHSNSGAKPRILQFVNSFHLGGTEGQVIELVRGLSQNYLPYAAAIHVQGAHLSAIRELGVEPLEIPLNGSLVHLQTAAQVFALASHLRRNQIDLVHAQDFYSSVIGVPAARLAGAKVVVGRLDLGHWHGKGQKWMLAAACRGAHHLIVNAQAIKEKIMKSEKISFRRISVIPNGIDLSRFDMQKCQALTAPLPLLEGKKIVVHLANMIHPVKAQELLLEAMKKIVQEKPDTALLLVGDGPRRPLLERMVGELGLSNHVHFLGYRTDVPALLMRCQVGVLCSDAEGLSNAIIEAMAAGLPMVVTNAGGNRELVHNGENGFVVPVRQPSALAARLVELLESETLRQRLGAVGRQMVERELTPAALLAKHDAVYRQVLAPYTNSSGYRKLIRAKLAWG